VKSPSIGTLSFGFIGVTAVLLAIIGPPGSRSAPPPNAPTDPTPASVSAAGITLASIAVDQPIDNTQYPDGPHADLINANCTGCHSASMALNQPALSVEQWKGEVTKMRETYKAPVAERDVPAIIAYLTAMSSKLTGASQPALSSRSVTQEGASDGGAG
jgi:hypothetical protein